MKRLHLIFGIIALLVFTIGLIHGSIAWIVAATLWNPLETSMPTWVAFILPFLIYCAITLLILLLWLITWLTVFCIRKKRIANKQ